MSGSSCLGTTAAICTCSPDGESMMSYVGINKGEWVAETTYKYVGKGMGEFNVGQDASAQKSTWNWCHYVAAAAACAVVVFAGVLLWPASGGSSSQKSSPRVADCQVGYDNWKTGWSAAKKEFCCKEVGRGCPSKSATAEVFECDAHDKSVWSAAKQSWCCDNKKMRCATA